MTKIKRTGSSGRLSPRQPSRLAATKVVRPPGPSAQSVVARQMFWSVKNANDQANADNIRQQDESLVGHFDIQPTAAEATDPATTTLQQQQPEGVTGGSTLTAAGQLPTGFIPPPA